MDAPNTAVEDGLGMAATQVSLSSVGTDIVYALLDHLDQTGIAAMMRTSKGFHSAGLRPLLRSGVTVKSKKQLAGFCKFILSDVLVRAPYLPKLAIMIKLDGYDSFGEESSDDSQHDHSDSTAPSLKRKPSKGMRLLVEVLEHATELADLSISWCEQLLRREKRLISKISNLPKLRCLQVSSVGSKTRSTMARMSSRLVDLDLFCYRDYTVSPYGQNLMPYIRLHCNTLERLTVWDCGLHERNADVVFPRMHALALRISYGIDVGLLSRVFPNLQYLELTQMASSHNSTDALRLSNVGKCRNGSWIALDHLSGGLQVLFGLAYPRSVKRLDIESVFMEPAAVTLNRLHTLITDTSPSHLLLHIGYAQNTYDTAVTSRLLAVPKASKITHLVLDICLVNLTGSVEDLQDGLVSMLSALSVTFFVLRLNASTQSQEVAKRSANIHVLHFARVSDVSDALKTAQQDELVRRLSLASLHLRHVSFDIMHSQPRYWSITRENGNTTISILNAEVGLQLLNSEGLWFNDKTVRGLAENL